MDDRRKRAVKLGAAIALALAAGAIFAINSGALSPPPVDPRVAEAQKRAEELAAQSRDAGFNDAPPPPAAREKPEGSGRRPLPTAP
ncbi:MAG: hypothetical protein FJ255_04915 [Phycisphaerae bacterium]|nr:hypothetical protein [Phycisphaerae bacterium]